MSIGYGCRLPLTEDEAAALFESRLSKAWRLADEIIRELAIPTWIGIAREGVITEMTYQLGAGGVRLFVKFLAALKAGDWKTAADEILDSQVARKQPSRWGELAATMRTGVAP